MTPDLARLLDWFRPHAAGGVALAYSGGIDSAVLLAALATLRHESDFPCVALTLSTPLQRCAEVDEARVLAEGLGVPWRKIEANPLAEPAVATNAPDRCYACKRLIMARLREVAQGAPMPMTAAPPTVPVFAHSMSLASVRLSSNSV